MTDTKKVEVAKPLTPYQIAQKELGQKEIPGPKSNPRIIAYHQATTLKAKDEAVPWCASFMSWCIDTAKKQGWVGPESTKAAWARSYLSWGKSVKKNPQIGDVCVFTRGKSKSQGHVAFFAGWTRGGTRIRTLGGNQGDAVNYSEYSKSSLLDIRRG